jgi:hypothetical protein
LTSRSVSFNMKVIEQPPPSFETTFSPNNQLHS